LRARLFLQPDFGRQTLIDRTGLSKDRIGAAFAQGSDSSSLPAYVRELRLDYAVRMMNDQLDSYATSHKIPALSPAARQAVGKLKQW